jgi:hypothetical protein
VTNSLWRRIRDDLKDRRHVEAYAVAGVTIIFAAGFSLVAINPNTPMGRIIVELHGFRNESIGRRMNFEIDAKEPE